MMANIKITELVCERCGHTWVARKKEVRQCPKCKSAYWDSPKKVEMKEMNKQKTFNEIKNVILSHKNRLTQKYKVKEIGIFGSAVHNEQRKRNDLDILIEYSEPISLLTKAGLLNYLRDILHEHRIDLVDKGLVRSEIKSNILKETVYI